MIIWHLKPETRLLLILAITFTCPCPAAIATPDTLNDDSAWTVNINGSVFNAKLRRNEDHTADDSIIKGKLFTRKQDGHVWSGFIKVSLGELGGSARLMLPGPGDEDRACQGTLARDGSFLAGTCYNAIPFIMVPTPQMQSTPLVRRLSSKIEKCETDLQKQKADNIRMVAEKFDQCQAQLRTQRSQLEAKATGNTEPPRKKVDAKRIANTAASKIPFYTKGGDCPTCDAAMYLDVPDNPPGNSDEGRWLNQLLEAQNNAIYTLFDTAGINLLRSEEEDICRRSRTCSALYRQTSISAAADLLGGRR